MKLLQKTLVIIGGGIAGLAAACRAQTRLPDVNLVLLESSDQLGGVLQTETVDGYVIEKSADMFTTDPPAAMELCQQLGTTGSLIQTNPTRDRAYVATADSFHPVPRGLSLLLPGNLETVMNSPLLDSAARLRFAAERNIPPSRLETDESLEAFAVRRFGQSAFDRMIQPLVGGIYTADPKRLSMQATMARFVKMEKKYGSLIRAAQSIQPQAIESEASGARYGMFRAPENGLGQLVSWLQQALTGVQIRTGCSVHSVSRVGKRWVVETQGSNAERESINADGVVLATPAKVSGNLLQSVDQDLKQKLKSIGTASSAVVVMGIDKTQTEIAFAGYGVVVPSMLNRKVIATSFSSNKFAGRAPEGKLLVRCFMGGALQGELVDLDDEQLVQIASAELAVILGFRGDPELSRVFRWRNCMPQYHLGHLDLVAEIERMVDRQAGLELAGNSYRGVGIPACIQSGTEAIERLAKCFEVG